MMACPCTCFKKIDAMINPLRNLADKIGAPLFDLAIRLYMANIFFNSGWMKFQNYLNDDWGSTVYLFEDIHPVPGLSPDIAAIMGTGGEIILSVLLAFGLFGRFAAAGLLMMTITIQYLIPESYGLQNEMHYLWMFLFLSILIRGAGKISLDTILRRSIK